MRIALALVVVSLLTPLTASAQHTPCREATAEDVAASQSWIVHADDVAVGRCGAHDAFCFVVAQTLCETSLNVDSVAASAMNVAGARVLVLRWAVELGEGTAFRNGSGTEVWRIDGAPTRVLAVLEHWREGDANPVRSEILTRCAAGRTLELTAEHVVISDRVAGPHCGHIPYVDRRGRTALGARPRTFTWDELLGSGR